MNLRASKPAVSRVVSGNLRGVNSVRELVSGQVRRSVGHCFPQPSDRTYTRGAGAPDCAVAMSSPLTSSVGADIFHTGCGRATRRAGSGAWHGRDPSYGTARRRHGRCRNVAAACEIAKASAWPAESIRQALRHSCTPRRGAPGSRISAVAGSTQKPRLHCSLAAS